MRKEACTTARFFLVLAAFAIGVALTACERLPTGDNPITTEIGTAYSEKAAEVTDLKPAVRMQGEQYGKLREEKIQELQNAFLPISDDKPMSETPWKDGVSGRERPNIFNMICEGLDQFQAMSWALRDMDTNGGVYNISWDELNIHEVVARLLHHELGIETARLMIGMMVEIPRNVRKHVEPCSRGEGSWNFSNELDEFENLVGILDAINPTEEKLGVSKQDLRDLIILQLMLHIDELRNAAVGGYISQDDALDCLVFMTEDAGKKWGIPLSSFGLSPEIVKIMRKRQDAVIRECREEINLTLMR